METVTDEMVRKIRTDELSRKALETEFAQHSDSPFYRLGAEYVMLKDVVRFTVDEYDFVRVLVTRTGVVKIVFDDAHQLSVEQLFRRINTAS